MTTIDELIEKAAIALAVDDFAGAQFSQWTDGAKEPYLRRAKAVADALALSSLQEQKRKLEEALNGLVDEAKHLNGWLLAVAACDMGEVVADGGITAAMCVGQEADERQKRLRRSLQDVFDARALLSGGGGG